MDKLLSALFEAKKEIKPAIKSAANPFFNKKYADLKEIDHAVKSALENHGLVIIQTTRIGEGNMPILITYLYHVESGQMISSEYPISYVKPDPQGIGSGLTYARRYQIACICGVITEDDDGEKAMDRTTEPKTYTEKTVSPLPNPVKEKPKSAKEIYINKLTSAKDLIELQSLTAEVKPEWNTDQFKAFVKTLEHKLRKGFEEEIKDLFDAEETKPRQVRGGGEKK